MAVGTPTPQPQQEVTFNTLTTPQFLQAVGNPMIIEMEKAPYRVGDLFFVEVWKLSGKNVKLGNNDKTGATLLQTLMGNGSGGGTCSIDISNVLNSQFRHDTTTRPNPRIALQKDESAYCMYFIKAGYITYDSRNRIQKVVEFESDVNVALRAALPLDTPNDLTSYGFSHTGQLIYHLTSLPDTIKRKRDEDTYLPFFIPLKASQPADAEIKVTADIYFNGGSYEVGVEMGEFSLASGGVYLYNAKPAIFSTQPQYANIHHYTIYLKYIDEDEDDRVTIARPFTIYVQEVIQDPIRVDFMNRLGAWDSLQFTRNRETEIKTKPQTFLSNQGRRVYQVDTQTQLTYYSPWLTPKEYEWLKDLMVSPYLVIDNKIVNPADTTYKLDSSLGLFSIELQVTPMQEENTLKL